MGNFLVEHFVLFLHGLSSLFRQLNLFYFRPLCGVSEKAIIMQVAIIMQKQ